MTQHMNDNFYLFIVRISAGLPPTLTDVYRGFP
jgi:hypothetical protein